jgi:hypothetical protein
MKNHYGICHRAYGKEIIRERTFLPTVFRNFSLMDIIIVPSEVAFQTCVPKIKFVEIGVYRN